MKARVPYTFSSAPLTVAERTAARDHTIFKLDRTSIRYVVRQPSILERLDAAVDRAHLSIRRAFS